MPRLAALGHRARRAIVGHRVVMIVRRTVAGCHLRPAMLVRPRRGHAAENGSEKQKGEEQALDHVGGSEARSTAVAAVERGRYRSQIRAPWRHVNGNEEASLHLQDGFRTRAPVS